MGTWEVEGSLVYYDNKIILPSFLLSCFAFERCLIPRVLAIMITVLGGKSTWLLHVRNTHRKVVSVEPKPETSENYRKARQVKSSYSCSLVAIRIWV
jgi:hypothetical protein